MYIHIYIYIRVSDVSCCASLVGQLEFNLCIASSAVLHLDVWHVLLQPPVVEHARCSLWHCVRICPFVCPLHLGALIIQMTTLEGLVCDVIAPKSQKNIHIHIYIYIYTYIHVTCALSPSPRLLRSTEPLSIPWKSFS